MSEVIGQPSLEEQVLGIFDEIAEVNHDIYTAGLRLDAAKAEAEQEISKFIKEKQPKHWNVNEEVLRDPHIKSVLMSYFIAFRETTGYNSFYGVQIEQRQEELGSLIVGRTVSIEPKPGVDANEVFGDDNESTSDISEAVGEVISVDVLLGKLMIDESQGSPREVYVTSRPTDESYGQVQIALKILYETPLD